VLAVGFVLERTRLGSVLEVTHDELVPIARWRSVRVSRVSFRGLLDPLEVALELLDVSLECADCCLVIVEPIEGVQFVLSHGASRDRGGGHERRWKML
jgi:hypothetical protein